MEGLHIFSQTEIIALPSWYIGTLISLAILFGFPSAIMLEDSKRKVIKVISGIVFTATVYNV